MTPDTIKRLKEMDERIRRLEARPVAGSRQSAINLAVEERLQQLESVEPGWTQSQQAAFARHQSQIVDLEDAVGQLHEKVEHHHSILEWPSPTAQDLHEQAVSQAKATDRPTSTDAILDEAAARARDVVNQWLRHGYRHAELDLPDLVARAVKNHNI